MEPGTPEPVATAPESSSLAGRVLNIFAAPGEVFDEIKDRPVVTANWLLPVILLVVLGWISSAVIFSQDFPIRQITEMQETAQAKALQKRVEKGQMTQQQADQAKQAVERMQGVTTIIVKVSAYVAPPFLAAGTLFFWALVLWLADKVLKPSQDSNGQPPTASQNPFGYMKAVEVVGLSMMIDALGAVVKTLVILVKGSIFASPSLAFLVDFNPVNPLCGWLGALNVMTLWSLAVVSIGFARVSGASFVRAASWVFGVWAAGMVAILGSGALINAVFNR